MMWLCALPALVLHGTADPIIPAEHGRKLATVIPGAKGLWLEDVGHTFPFPDMALVMRHLLAHLDGQTVSA